MTIVFKTVAQKNPIKNVLVPKIDIVAFSQNVPLRQSWGYWFQIWKRFLKFLAQKHTNKTFLVPNLGIFVFLGNFSITQIRGSWFQT